MKRPDEIRSWAKVQADRHLELYTKAEKNIDNYMPKEYNNSTESFDIPVNAIFEVYTEGLSGNILTELLAAYEKVGWIISIRRESDEEWAIINFKNGKNNEKTV